MVRRVRVRGVRGVRVRVRVRVREGLKVGLSKSRKVEKLKV
jgi:hypothetical protein